LASSVRKQKKRSKTCHLTAIAASIFLLLAGCQPATPPSEDATGEALLPESPVNQQIQDAFRLADPAARKEAVLSATGAFLRDATMRQRDDTAASRLLTRSAFQSGQLVLSDPAFVRHQGTLVVVGLPDGLGLFLYDLSTSSDSLPLQITPWIVGLSAVDVTWAGNEIGVSYRTVDANRASWVHFAMVNKSEAVWRVSWLSDEQPDWWFNTRNAVMTVAPYLSRLTVTGQAIGSTSIFDESGTAPLRTFKVEWLREQDHYRLSPAMGVQKERQSWIWKTAQPSTYATLVEFIEHIRLLDSTEAGHLASDSSVVTSAFAFGLHLSDDRYRVTASTETTITFQGQQGAFVATFRPPESENAPWLITSLQPLGAIKPTPEPTSLP
jgi:hypothetical protein